MLPRLAISNSGGRTSALMTKLCLEQFRDSHEIVVTFANTGIEHEATLNFIRDCDAQFGFETVWLEAVVGGKGTGIRHKVVNYETASRNGEPFEAYIAKHGIPNRALPQCTSRLKTEVMQSYLATRGFVRGVGLNYDTAIGIRADEFDRISTKAKAHRYVYPLIKAGITKADVIEFWKHQPFDLKLPGEHFGNCVTCWKKSFRKLMTIAIEQPERFDFFNRMEHEHRNTLSETGAGRVFFRENKSCQDIFKMAQEPFEKYVDQPSIPDAQIDLWPCDPSMRLDIGSGCSESCEIGADD